MVLEDPSPSLHTKIFQIAETLLQYESFVGTARVKALLHLEVARAYLFYSNVVKSEEHINSTLKLLNMDVELIGKSSVRLHDFYTFLSGSFMFDFMNLTYWVACSIKHTTCIGLTFCFIFKTSRKLLTILDQCIVEMVGLCVKVILAFYTKHAPLCLSIADNG